MDRPGTAVLSIFALSPRYRTGRQNCASAHRRSGSQGIPRRRNEQLIPRAPLSRSVARISARDLPGSALHLHAHLAGARRLELDIAHAGDLEKFLELLSALSTRAQ